MHDQSQGKKAYPLPPYRKLHDYTPNDAHTLSKVILSKVTTIISNASRSTIQSYPIQSSTVNYRKLKLCYLSIQQAQTLNALLKQQDKLAGLRTKQEQIAEQTVKTPQTPFLAPYKANSQFRLSQATKNRVPEAPSICSCFVLLSGTQGEHWRYYYHKNTLIQI